MSLTELLAQIDKNQAFIQSQEKLDKEILKKINYKFRLDWNYYSNRMEGGTLTREETRSVMIGNISVEGKPIKDVMEMNGHDKVVLDILKIGKGEQRLSEKKIQEIHKAIMHEEEPEKAKLIGKWKVSAIEIINYKSEKISFTPPAEVSEVMHALLDKTNAELDAFLQDNNNKQHPLFIASDFHLGYVSIHPFYDGNGRTARIFSNLILIACGFPVIIIKDEHKDRYYKTLEDIQAYGGNPELFYEFIAERVIDSQNLIISAIKGEEIEEADDLDKRIKLLKKRSTSDKKITERKSTEVIYKVLVNIAFPLFKELEAKFSELNELFFEHYCNAGFFDNSGIYFQVKNRDHSWDQIKEQWLQLQFLSQPGNMRAFQFHYSLNGYLLKTEAPSFHTGVNFEFDDYNYLIISSSESKNNGLKKAYGETISQTEKKEIFKKTVGSIVEQIERLQQDS
jgi:Fic family protein